MGLRAARATSRTGASASQRRAHVLLATFTYENVRLLLSSTLRAVPARPRQTAAGQVGKHYMAHITPFVFGLFPGRRPEPVHRAVVAGDLRGRLERRQLRPHGARLRRRRAARRSARAAADRRGGNPLPPSVPRWGSPWKAWLTQNAQSVGYLSAQVESLSYEDNFLDLDPVARDSFGAPVVRVTHRPRENERRSAAFMLEKLRIWLEAAGASETWHDERLLVEARHCYGGTRMGRRSRAIGRRPVRLLARGAEPRDPRHVDLPDDRRPQPDADAPGARVADRRERRLETSLHQAGRRSASDDPAAIAGLSDAAA